VTTSAWQVAALHDAWGKDEQVFRAKRIRLWRHIPQKKVSGQSPTAYKQPVEIVSRFFNVRSARGEIYVQDLAVCTTNHCQFPFLIASLLPSWSS
jgi:hypothetical protein